MTKDIRNFCIIAHIDHGKSTLADRMLQITETIEKRAMRDQYLDKIDLERERGITIKLQAVRMEWKGYILNLIDTPGHIDFSYEVSRALAACEGALLLVDASQGIQAQTLANYFKAQEAGLKIIPVVNKVDLPQAQPDEVTLDLVETFGFRENEILYSSGKTGQGVEDILQAVIDRTPAPRGQLKGCPRALIFDSYYDQHLGVIALTRIVDGSLKNTDTLRLMNSHANFKPSQIGYITDHLLPEEELTTGEVGYIATGLKDIAKVRVGDTITAEHMTSDVIYNSAEALPGYKEPKPMVFANLFPENTDQLRELRDAVEKYNLTDAAFTFKPINSPALGMGFKCGFLGLLHLDVVRERLEQEYNVSTQVTAPSVAYKVELTTGEQKIVLSPEDLPDPNQIKSTKEPWCKVQILSQEKHLGDLMKLSEAKRGQFVDLQYIGTQGERVQLSYRMPLSEIISNFFDQIKSVSSGYASLDYEVSGYHKVNLAKLDILLNKEKFEVLARLVVREQAQEIAEKLVQKLREELPRQQFSIPIQAAIGGKILARADLSARRKNVTAKLYGGDRTRKDKLLKKQAAGKKKLQEQGKVQIPSKAYQKILGL